VELCGFALGVGDADGVDGAGGVRLGVVDHSALLGFLEVHVDVFDGQGAAFGGAEGDDHGKVGRELLETLDELFGGHALAPCSVPWGGFVCEGAA